MRSGLHCTLPWSLASTPCPQSHSQGHLSSAPATQSPQDALSASTSSLLLLSIPPEDDSPHTGTLKNGHKENLKHKLLSCTSASQDIAEYNSRVQSGSSAAGSPVVSELQGGFPATGRDCWGGQLLFLLQSSLAEGLC